MRYVCILISTLCLICVKADVQDDYNYLVSIFQGLYDNYVQYETDIKHALPPAYRHQHLTTSVVEQDVPVLQGRKSFYLEQYLNGSKDNLIRQRIYSFAIDAMKRINLKIYSLVDQAKFAHAKPNSPLFKQLTMNDIVYAKGCDVYWNRVSDDLFRTNMFNTCIVPIQGAEVLIIDKSTLSSTYLTADETWIFIKNGSVLQVYPGPYNMTKQSPVPVKSSNVDKTPPQVTSSQLGNFQDILNALVAGHPVRYYLKITSCMMAGGQVPKDQPHIGGYIDAFEYFNDPDFGPHPHFGFSAFLLKRNESGGLIIDLREGLVYKDGHIELKLTTLTPDYQIVINIQKFNCNISPDASSGSALFYSSGAKITQISDFKTFATVLETGGHVRFTVNYALCTLAVGAIGGGRIDDFDVSPDGTIVKSSQYKIITNYQGPGYVSDIVIGSFYSNSSAIFIASDVIVDTDKAFYVEEIDCEINGLRPGGGVYLYQIQ